MLRTYLDSFLGKLSDFQPWSDRLGEFYGHLADKGMSVNFVPLIGHGTVRIAVLGFDMREPTQGELDEMKAYVEEGMRDGAFGLSTGLIYPPGVFAKTDEIVELAKVAAVRGGIYTSHIRGEGDTLRESVEEAIEIGNRAKISVQISHIKTTGRRNWGKSGEIIQLIESARMNGIDVTADQYPYVAGQTGLYALLPPWAQEGGIERIVERLQDSATRERMKTDFAKGIPGWQNWVADVGWENIMVVQASGKNKPLEGKRITEIAKGRGKPPAESVFDLLVEEGGRASMVVFYGSEDDIKAFMKQPWVMIGSDQNGIKPGEGPLGGKQHPRAYGTFPRVLGKYVREERVLSIEDAIRKMTGLPAQKLGLRDRGLIRENMWADIVTFDPLRIIDKATYENPSLYAEGVTHVIVNGVVVYEGGNFTGARPGKVLQRLSCDRMCP
jgi:N-acyl-D-amino-acid deacylase